MKAGYLAGVGKIEIRETPAPVIKNDDDVLIKVERIGVCGSDIHYFKDGRIGTQTVDFPFRIGHEFSGTVAETGKKVSSLKKGDKVAVDPAVFCGKCDLCRAGKFNLCRTLLFMGSPGLKDGCLAEYVIVPERGCFKSEKLSLDELCIVEPLSIAVYALKYALPLKGKTIGILGAGAIGMSVLICAAAEEAGAVYVTDKLDYRCGIAEKHGAAWTGNPLKTDIVKEIGKKEPLLLDVVFECCGEQDALDQAQLLLKPGGFLVIVGIHTVSSVSFSTDLMRRREITVYNVRRQNESALDALKLIESGRVKTDFMITHRFGMDQSQAAYETAAEYKDNVIKAFIIP